jgi:hypothetical protein
MPCAAPSRQWPGAGGDPLAEAGDLSPSAGVYEVRRLWEALLRMSLGVPFVLLAMVACGRPLDPGAILDVRGDGTTGLEGTVSRGPITPVCLVGVPCDAPFHAGFQVLLGRLVVDHFESDAAGHYTVLLVPGTYGIRPDSGAAVWPQGQTLEAVVGSPGLTHLDLEFDTGIR